MTDPDFRAAEKALAPDPDPVLESQGWPWYEARLSVHVRPSKPTDAFGEGGEELAHARAWTQAPSFPEAVSRLDGDLARKWDQITANAELVDQEPSPEVLPKPTPWWLRQVGFPAWAVVIFVVGWLAAIANVLVLVAG